METKYGYGPRFVLDCYDCPKEKLADRGYISAVLASFHKKMGAAGGGEPHVFGYQEGITGVVVAEGWHVSVHTFPDKGQAFVDVFSCQELDIDYFKQELTGLLGAARHEVTIDYKLPGNSGWEQKEEPKRIYH